MKTVIKGKNITLRSLQLSDADHFLTWMSDPEVVMFLSSDSIGLSAEEERAWILKAKKSKNGIFLSIDTKEGEHIGIVSLRKISTVHKNAELGITIGNKKYWGQGLGTEAVILICKYGFRKCGLKRIYLNVIAYNTRGINAYKRVGFKKEGVMRQHIFKNGYFHDYICMGLLKNEFSDKNK